MPAAKAKDEFGNFSFQTASPGMAKLMAKLYTIRSDCGYTITDKEFKAELGAKDEMVKNLNQFERLKMESLKKVDEIKEKMELRKELMKKAGRKDPTQMIQVTNEIQKCFSQLDAILKSMQEYQQKANSGLKTFFRRKTSSPDLNEDKAAAEREQVMSNLRVVIKKLKESNRRIALVEDEPDLASSSKLAMPPGFTSMDSFQKENYEQEMPEFDISSGLQQIDEEKKKQDRILDEISLDLKKLEGISEDFSSEIDAQKRLLDKITDDVVRYRTHLSQTNKKLTNTIGSVKGSGRMLFLIAFLLLLLFLLLLGFLVVKFLVTGTL